MKPELIERLEAAEAGSRELDAEVFRALGWTDGHNVHGPAKNWWLNPQTGEHVDQLERVTTSVDAALGLIRERLPDSFVGFGNKSPRTGCPFAHIQGSVGDAHTPALALCAAFLRALFEELKP